MKKSIKILAFLFGTALLFLGCPQPAESPESWVLSSLENSGATTVVSSEAELQQAIASMMADPLVSNMGGFLNSVGTYRTNASRATVDDVEQKFNEISVKLEKFVEELEKNSSGNIDIDESFDSIEFKDGSNPIEGVEIKDIVFKLKADVSSEKEGGLFSSEKISANASSEISGKMSCNVAKMLASIPGDSNSGFSKDLKTGFKHFSVTAGEKISLSDVEVDIGKIGMFFGGVGKDPGVAGKLGADVSVNIALSYADIKSGLGGKFLVHGSVSASKSSDEILAGLENLLNNKKITEEQIIDAVLSLFDFDVYVKVFDDDGNQQFESKFDNATVKKYIIDALKLIPLPKPEYKVSF